MPIQSTNPTTSEKGLEYEALNAAELEQRLSLAESAFARQRASSFAERAEFMTRAAEILEREKRDFGILMTSEMGKPLASAIAEVEKCALVCRYYAEHADRFLANEEVATGSDRSFVAYQPLGPVLAVMPWNYPFWQVFRFAAPALMAGNVGLLKHASNVPGCALAIEDIFARAGFAEGVFQTLLLDTEQVAGVLEDPRVSAATLTGSEAAGSAVAGKAGSEIKKTVLELGGSDPFIVMPSADLDAAVSIAVKARTVNNGQSCIAAKRFIVADEVYDEFERRLVDLMSSLVVGDPMDERTDIGPLATAEIREGVHKQVTASIAAGARLLTGGVPEEGAGYFYPPTVLADVGPGSPAYEEEIFGPVASLFRVRGIDEAIRLANDTSFGLGSSAWTSDPAEQERFIRDLDAGQVFINAMVSSDPRLPFGGVKRSGYGRELGIFGIREFVNIKTVKVRT
ncbi:MAG TPA: NAD-dependent succinate-semialdehyde dehydrogenase [Longimicrobiaceae bacterium]|nr:NAD-dependent succinate-semialdehyde dehydrogenase [Longimicrobiaceae bacterium]